MLLEQDVHCASTISLKTAIPTWCALLMWCNLMMQFLYSLVPKCLHAWLSLALWHSEWLLYWKGWGQGDQIKSFGTSSFIASIIGVEGGQWHVGWRGLLWCYLIFSHLPWIVSPHSLPPASAKRQTSQEVGSGGRTLLWQGRARRDDTCHSRFHYSIPTWPL